MTEVEKGEAEMTVNSPYETNYFCGCCNAYIPKEEAVTLPTDQRASKRCPNCSHQLRLKPHKSRLKAVPM